jgi:hypothetical protein
MTLESIRSDLNELHRDFAHFSHSCLRKQEQSKELERFVGFISIVGLILATLSVLNLSGLKPLGIQLCPQGDPTALVVSLAVSSLFPLLKARTWVTSYTSIQTKRRKILNDSHFNTSVKPPPYSATLVRVENEQVALYIKEGKGWAYRASGFKVDEKSVTLHSGEESFPVIQKGKSNPFAVYLYLKTVKEAQFKKHATVEENPYRSLAMEKSNIHQTESKREILRQEDMKLNKRIIFFVCSISLLMAAAVFVSACSLSHTKFMPIDMNHRLAITLSTVGGAYFTWNFYEFGKTYFESPPSYYNLSPKHTYPTNVEIAKEMLCLDLIPFDRGFVYIGNPKKRYFAIRLDKETLILPVYVDDKPDQRAPQHKNKLVYNHKNEELSFIDTRGQRVLLSPPFVLKGQALEQLLTQLAS